MFFFFFSSRRRHTRLQGDWSSDVCSSDLVRDRRERRIGVDAERLDERRERRGEVLVVAYAELVPRHVHAAPEEAGGGGEGRQPRAPRGGGHRGRLGGGPPPQRPLQRPPRERRGPGPVVGGGAPG